MSAPGTWRFLRSPPLQIIGPTRFKPLDKSSRRLSRAWAAASQVPWNQRIEPSHDTRLSVAARLLDPGQTSWLESLTANLNYRALQEGGVARHCTQGFRTTTLLCKATATSRGWLTTTKRE